MALLSFIKGKRKLPIVDIIWMTSIASTSLLFMVIVVYDMDVDLEDDTVKGNRQILAENREMDSRESTLMQLVAELEMELAKSRKRIKRRLDRLDRSGNVLVETRRTGELGEPIRGGVLAPPQRLKRRLMDARSSLGREVGPGLYSDVSSSDRVGDRNNSRTSAWAIVSPAHGVNEGAKDNSVDNTTGIEESAPRNRSVLLAESSTEVHHNDNLFLTDSRSEFSTSVPLDTEGKSKNISSKMHKSKLSLILHRKKLTNSTKTSSSNGRSMSRDPITGPQELSKDFSDRSHDNRKNIFHKINSDMIGSKGNQDTFDRRELREATGGKMLTPLEAPAAPLLGCGDLARVNSRERIGSGYTKRVERARLGDGRTVALKSVLTDGVDVQTCKGLGMTGRDCVQLANYKLLKEIALLMQLQHPNILKLVGFCMSDGSREERGADGAPPTTSVTVLVELGTPLTFLGYLQMPWEERFRICLGISHLLAFLADSPIGSLSIHDFKMMQFVLVEGEVKLADLDDVDDGHRPCSSIADCGLKIGASNETVHSECRDGVCMNYSEMSNLVQAHATFFSLLQFDAPKGIAESVRRLLNNSKRALWSAGQIAAHMENTLESYREGQYLKGMISYSTVNDTQFQVIPDADLAGSDDYWCPGSRQLAAACVLSVHDAREAMCFCARDPQCRAFVMTTQRTWTGRTIAYFKKGISTSPQPSQGNTLYLFSR